MTSVIQCSERLFLVPFAERHLSQSYCDWLNDRQLMRHSRQSGVSHDLASCRAYWDERQRRGDHFWALEWQNGERRHIGNLTAYLNPPKNMANLAILVGAPQARGHGFGKTAFNAAAQWLLGPGGLHSVEAGTHHQNAAMLAILESPPWASVADGSTDDVLRYSVERNRS